MSRGQAQRGQYGSTCGETYGAHWTWTAAERMAAPRALIVDDDLGFQAGLAELVKREGFVGPGASSWQQAREEIPATPPDILLVDLHLPDGSGLDLLEGFEPASS